MAPPAGAAPARPECANMEGSVCSEDRPVAQTHSPRSKNTNCGKAAPLAAASRVRISDVMTRLFVDARCEQCSVSRGLTRA
eukprot:3240205-Rhodomonas_salina.2